MKVQRGPEETWEVGLMAVHVCEELQESCAECVFLKCMFTREREKGLGYNLYTEAFRDIQLVSLSVLACTANHGVAATYSESSCSCSCQTLSHSLSLCINGDQSTTPMN